MIVCPVCEHSQASGAECEVCGKEFAPGVIPAPPAVRMEGLETTHHGPVELPFNPAGAMPELEPTSAPPVDAPEERTPGIEPTSAAPVDVDSVAIPDIERIEDGIPDDAPTELPVAPTCRYCRTPAVPGERICSRCGMRLPVVDPVLVAGGAGGARQCSNCGTMTTRELCPACGARQTPVNTLE
jgi:RNA polymerase subunit RPABC4/transcription elongation factor Spt4